MTTFSTLQNDLFELLTEHSDKFASLHSASNAARLKRWLNSAVRQVETSFMFPELEESTTSSTVSEQELYALPSDCFKIVSLVMKEGDTRLPMERILAARFDEVAPSSLRSTSGRPSMYVEWDEQVGFYPIPNSADYTYELRYWALTGAMSDDADTPLLSNRDDIIIAFAAYQGLIELGIQEAAANLRALGQQGLTREIRLVETQPDWMTYLGAFNAHRRSTSDPTVPIP